MQVYLLLDFPVMLAKMEVRQVVMRSVYSVVSPNCLSSRNVVRFLYTNFLFLCTIAATCGPNCSGLGMILLLTVPSELHNSCPELVCERVAYNVIP